MHTVDVVDKNRVCVAASGQTGPSTTILLLEFLCRSVANTEISSVETNGNILKVKLGYVVIQEFRHDLSDLIKAVNFFDQ